MEDKSSWGPGPEEEFGSQKAASLENVLGRGRRKKATYAAIGGVATALAVLLAVPLLTTDSKDTQIVADRSTTVSPTTEAPTTTTTAATTTTSKPKPQFKQAIDGDIDGDGKVDNVTLRATGPTKRVLTAIATSSGKTYTINFESSGTYNTQVALADNPSANVDEELAGVRDFDRDGRAEVLVQVNESAHTKFYGFARLRGERFGFMTGKNRWEETIFSISKGFGARQ